MTRDTEQKARTTDLRSGIYAGHPPYNMDLAISDFHLSEKPFGGRKVVTK